MIKYFNIKGDKYNINCKIWNCENPEQIIIACHGFAGDKESSAIALLAEKLSKRNIVTLAFDLPGHGTSEVDGKYLTIENCLNDFNKVIEFVNNKYPNIKINLFGTSFGGYLILLLKNKIKNLSKVILRCPAIKMDEILLNEIIREPFENYQSKGYTVVGYERELKMDFKFYEQLLENKSLEIYNNNFDNMLIIHGNQDTTAPLQDTMEFSKKYDIKIEIVDGADHRFKKPGELDKVVELTEKFIFE